MPSNQRLPDPTVTIAAFGLEHVDALAQLQLSNYEDLVLVNPMPPRPALLGELRERLERAVLSDPGDRHAYAIFADGRLVGSVTLSRIIREPMECADVGVFVDAAVRGRGVATAAIGELCELAFTQMGLNRLQAGVQPFNIGSIRALEHNGFERVGVIKRMLFVNGAWRDHLLLVKLRPDGH